ncbi:MFS transporter [Streptomyces sp. NPDC091259]|uniref:MFS transporter n=1 Tax=Streptomyces sp. NPDC091259 TaxID=3365976 RepID=UPI003819AD4F
MGRRRLHPDGRRPAAVHRLPDRPHRRPPRTGCALAPGIEALVTARFAQGSVAAVMMPASMALIGHTYPETGHRARAVATWAMGGAVASSSGPVLGGPLTQCPGGGPSSPTCPSPRRLCMHRFEAPR